MLRHHWRANHEDQDPTEHEDSDSPIKSASKPPNIETTSTHASQPFPHATELHVSAGNLPSADRAANGNECAKLNIQQRTCHRSLRCFSFSMTLQFLLQALCLTLCLQSYNFLLTCQFQLFIGDTFYYALHMQKDLHPSHMA